MAVRKSTGSPNDNITEWMSNQPAADVLVDNDDELEDVFPEAPGQPATAPRPTEVPPKIQSPIERAVAKVKASVKAPPPRKTAPARAKPPKPRKSVENLIATAWRIGAQLVAPINLPVARTLDMQAPVAGLILEDVVKDTMVDKILQPLARIEGGGETAFALLGPPMLVGTITARPQMAPMLVPVLRQALYSWMELAGPHIKKVQERERKFQEDYGQDIDNMIAYLLGAVTPNATDEAHVTVPTSNNGTGPTT